MQDQKGKWELPGGTIKFGESPEETLTRELKEEMGMTDVKIGKIVDVWSVLIEADWAHYQFVGIVYECFSNQTEIVISEEHQNFIWASWDEIVKLEIGEHHKNTIRKYLDGK